MTVDMYVSYLQHAARYLANQEWVKNDSLKIVENTAVILRTSSISILGFLIFILLSYQILQFSSCFFSIPYPVLILVLDSHYHACGGSSS